MNYEKIVKEVIDEQKDTPIDILGIGGMGEYIYMINQLGAYIRTVRDIDNLLKADRDGRKVLEIGSFLGVVSISLKRLGYDVSALDIPEFYQSSSLRALYNKHEIHFDGVNLRNYKLPFESNSLDAVVICEVIEHLNFNPLPVLMEINRVLKDSGFIYIGMPNQASLDSRLKLLLGKSTHNSIRDFFAQLDRHDNMIVGLHWREYTLAETLEVLEKMGFQVVEGYYFIDTYRPSRNALKGLLKKLVYSYHPFRPYQVVIGKKTKVPVYDFWLTAANS